MINIIETMEERSSENYDSLLGVNPTSRDIKSINDELAQINKENQDAYIQAKSKEVATFFAKKLSERIHHVEEHLAKQKSSSGASRNMDNKGLKEKTETIDASSQPQFNGFLTTFQSYVTNLNYIAVNSKSLKKQTKDLLDSILKSMEKPLSESLKQQKWIFKDTTEVYKFLNVYFNILKDIREAIMIMDKGKNGLCCSSSNINKEIESKVSLLNTILFAFPVLFQLEPTKVTNITVVDASPPLDLKLLAFDHHALANDVRGILKDQFPKINPMYKLKVTKEGKPYNQEERLMQAPPSVIKESVKVSMSVSKTAKAKDLFHGFTQSKDYIKALQLFMEADKEGCGEASLYLGRIYLEGLGTRKNVDVALQHFSKAHMRGSTEGTYQLAKLIEKNSQNSPNKQKEFKAAIDLYTQAANKNHSEALTDLGYLHEKGVLEAPDFVKAESYYTKAINLNNPRAMNNLASILLTQVQSNTSPPQAKRIFELLDTAAKCGYPLALTNLGICYLRGVFVPQDLIAARQLFREAAEHHDPDGIFYSAYFLLKESNLGSSEKNYFEASNLLRRTLILNEKHADALYYMGYLYENGLGVDQDYKTAFKFYKDAVEASNEKDGKSLYKLATLFYTGQNATFPDKALALSLYLKAAHLNDPDALYVLGVIHEEGIDIEQNVKLAIDFYKRSAQQGNTDAQLNLGLLMIDQSTQGNEMNKKQTVPSLLQTIKSNCNDDTCDDVEQAQADRLIIDAAKRGNERAQKVMENIHNSKATAYPNIAKALSSTLYKENVEMGSGFKILKDSGKWNHGKDFAPWSMFSGKSLLNNYMRV